MNRSTRNWITTGISVAALAVSAFGLSITAGCDNQSSVVNQNMKEDADNFRIARHIRVINTRSQQPIYELEGYCNVDKGDSLPNELIFICKGETPGTFKKNFAFLNDNVTVSVEQMDDIKESTFHYRIMFNPSVVIPTFEMNHGQ